jgi:hypothetical protein
VPPQGRSITRLDRVAALRRERAVPLRLDHVVLLRLDLVVPPIPAPVRAAAAASSVGRSRP